MENYVPKPVFSRNNREQVVTDHVERIIKRPVERVVERVVENLIERPVYQMNTKEHVVTRPIEKVIEKPVEHIIEKPVYRTNIIKRPVPVERRVEEIFEIHQDREVIEHVQVDVHKPRFNRNKITQQVEREVIRNVDRQNFIDIHVDLDEVTSRPLRLVQERPQASELEERTEIEYLVHKQRPVPVEDIIEIAVPKFNKQMNYTEVEVPVKVVKIIEEAVACETEVLVDVENKIERPIYEEVIEERHVTVNREVIEYYDVIKEKIIEVEREEDVEVAIKTRIQKPVENFQTLEERVAVDRHVVQPVKGRDINDGSKEVTDANLAHSIETRRHQMKMLQEENHRLRGEFKHFEQSVRGLGTNEYNSISRQLADLRSTRSELQSRISIMMKDTERLMHTSNSRAAKTQMSYTTIAPEVFDLRRRLETLIKENRSLVSQARTHQHR